MKEQKLAPFERIEKRSNKKGIERSRKGGGGERETSKARSARLALDRDGAPDDGRLLLNNAELVKDLS